MNNFNPLTCIDFYKADHRRQYPEGTELVFSNLTPRYNKHANVPNKGEVVFFGLQYFLQEYLMDAWHKNFFQKDLGTVLAEYKRRMDTSLGVDSIATNHIAALHELGYLPVEIRALPEGTVVPIGMPVLTIHNTHKEFFWITNYLETILSAYLWLPCTSATTAYNYRVLLERFARLTGSPEAFVDFQGHDFSFRGMEMLQGAIASGMAHLVFFKGTDTVPAIDFLEKYYFARASSELIGCSVPATEHSVMCMGGEEDELETFERLITKVYPKGIVSIVSDTWDFWKVITEYADFLKDTILERDGKVVFRPDSGKPTDILCGDLNAELGSPEYKGAVECLWDIFEGTITETGHKLLDSHVGLIYGDSITYAIAEDILKRLQAKGFASANVVFGIGSYTYQYVTRDTWGWAVKATYGEVNGEPRNIFKKPKTDDGGKNSACGLLRVVQGENESLVLEQKCSWKDVGADENLLKLVFSNGWLQTEYLSNIRERGAAAVAKKLGR